MYYNRGSRWFITPPLNRSRDQLRQIYLQSHDPEWFATGVDTVLNNDTVPIMFQELIRTFTKIDFDFKFPDFRWEAKKKEINDKMKKIVDGMLYRTVVGPYSRISCNPPLKRQQGKMVN